MEKTARDLFRSEVLSAFGASPDERDQLLWYNRNLFDHSALQAPMQFPLEDEAFIKDWISYEKEAQSSGVFESLKRRLIQLWFPIEKGMSLNENYLAATKRGLPVENMREATGLKLNRPHELKLIIHQSLAGHIPLVITADREDFVSLVRALIMKNEPEPIPESTGAWMVSGYNNWDRVRELRKRWEVLNPFGNWAEEFKRIIPQKDLYQDRFILLSDGPYSNIPAKEMGLSEEEWRISSLILRREHECTHYFTRRVFSSMRMNVIDELIADYRGIVAACGMFCASWFLRFIGLEQFPLYKKGGRLENYRGEPPLSEGSFKVLQKLVKQAVENLERFDRNHASELRTERGEVLMLLALTRLTLEELASEESEVLIMKSLEEAKKTFVITS